jgi:hypothetical protein
LFNKDAEKMLGCTAKELCEISQGVDLKAFQAVVSRAMFSQWQFKILAVPSVHEGKKKIKWKAHDLEPIDLVKETAFLLEQVAALEKL